jgi:hypothetical protein
MTEDGGVEEEGLGSSMTANYWAFVDSGTKK